MFKIWSPAYSLFPNVYLSPIFQLLYNSLTFACIAFISEVNLVSFDDSIVDIPLVIPTDANIIKTIIVTVNAINVTPFSFFFICIPPFYVRLYYD